MQDSRTATRTWLRAQTRLARRGAAPVVACGLVSVIAAIAGAWCAAAALAQALAGKGIATLPLLGFVVAALVQAGIGILSEHASFEAGAPQRLFDVPSLPLGTMFEEEQYAPAADGQRFLVRVPVSETSLPPATVVLNWPTGIRK